MEAPFMTLSRRNLLLVLMTALLLLSGVVGLAAAQPDAVVVNVFTDDAKNNDGTCSLREAIIAANKDKQSGGKNGECKNVGGADTILLPPGVYTLSRTDNGNEDSSATGDLDISSDITIRPTGPGLVVISGDGITDRIFHILSGTVRIEGVTIRDGRAGDFGGGIYNQGGNLTLVNSTLTGSRAGSAGGGLYNSATAALTNVTIAENSAPGGSGLANTAALTLQSTLLANDTCQGSYGGGDNLAFSATGCTGSSGDPLLAAQFAAGLPGRPAYFAIPLASAAVNAVSSGAPCPAIDQLGLARPQGSACDIGAIELEIVNVGPTAGDDELLTDEDTAKSLDVSVNDSDPEGDLNLGSVTIQTPPSSGTAEVTGSPNVTYTPNANFEGGDSFTYSICDGAGQCDEATVTVTVTADAFIEVTTASSSGDGSLAWAIDRANQTPGTQTIIFQIGGADSCSAETISLAAPLPAISEPVTIDGSLQKDGDRCPVHITLTQDANADPGFSGLTILSGGGGTVIRDLNIVGFSGSGIVIGPDAPSDNNLLLGNTISGNGFGALTVPGPNGTTIPLNDGVTIIGGVNNNYSGSVPGVSGTLPNNINGNADLGVDLGGDGETSNDFGDGDLGANFVQNYPSLFRAGPDFNTNKLVIEGFLHSRPNSAYTLQFYESDSCLNGDLSLLALDNPAEATVTTGQIPGEDAGDVFFSLTMATSVAQGRAIRATATDAQGNTSEFSPCIRVGAGNDTWPAAMRLNGGGQTVNQYLDTPGQSRWYKIKVDPDGKVSVTLKNLSKNYDVVIFKDIAQAYAELLEPQNLNRLSAEFAADAIAPSALSPSALSPSALSPSALSPSALSPENFAPSALSPSALSPSALSPSALSPDAISPSALSPSALSPSALSPSAFSPSALSPSALSPEVYASAQSRSLIGVSAFDGLATETITVNTWGNSGDFYIRVRGREGAFDPNNTFTIDVSTVSLVCNAYSDALAANPLPATSLGGASGFDSLFLVDWTRLADVYGGTAVSSLQSKLTLLSGEVNGTIVNVGLDARVSAANDLANAYPECPAAKNLVAGAIKDVIDRYDGIDYITIVGSDDIIPFYRYPDNALLGPESDYVPPVLDSSASQASLRNNYVLGQDGYGAPFGISFKDNVIPVPRTPVGRLVEYPAEIEAVIDAYRQGTTNGVAPTPSSTLITGYDFMYDVALEVQAELEAGTGSTAEVLLTDPSKSPLDPSTWTAEQLAAKLAQQRYDITFLAGHFSANSALAADYATSLITTDLLDLTQGLDLRNALVFSNGCHSGYNIPFADSVPGVTFNPDWAQAFAQRGATLIAGTGYQYGDTDFIEYSERLYLNFSRELRTGTGPVAIGDAFVAAKQTYLAETPVLRGIHEKALLESTIFGLPFLKIDMPGQRITPQGNGSVIGSTTAVSGDPGQTLGLSFANYSVSPQYTPPADTRRRTLELLNIDDDSTVTASWWTGSDGVVSNPGEPALPLEAANVAVAGQVLRGIGFRGGVYEDLPNSQPLVGAPTTELRAVHLAFLSNVFFPLRPWSVNYFDVLADSDNGATTFNVFPAQYLADSPEPETATLRLYDQMDFRLFYSNYIATAGANEPALAAEPTIVSVLATYDEATETVNFEVVVVGNPGAGIQNVWVTYTGLTGGLHGSWQSLDLTQSPDESTLWTGSLGLAGTNTPAADVRFIAQAVSGVGLVSRVDNIGRYYMPGGDIERDPTQITLLPGANGGKVGQTAVFEATLTDSSGAPLGGRLVAFGLGQETRIVRTDGQGKATAEVPLLARPDIYLVTASFLGDVEYAPSTSAAREFTINPQQTKLSLQPLEATYLSPDEPVAMLALLEDVDGRPLSEKSVLFEISGGAQPVYKAVITDLLGQARLGKVTLDGTVTSYAVKATFAGTASYDPAETGSGLSGSGGTLVANRPPVCDDVYALTDKGKDSIWPANNKMTGVVLGGATDPDGDPLTYRFVSIFQDEPIGGDLDGSIANSCTTAEVRGQRDGNGDGRVYHLNFIVEDGRGGTCSGETTIATIPHDQGGVEAIDQGPLFNSLGEGAPACTP